MSNYSKNLTFLQKFAPVLHDALLGEIDLFPSKVIDTSVDNVFQIIVADRIVHCNSLYSMGQEFEYMFKEADKNCEVLIVFGIGNGQILRYIKQNFINLKSLYIVEPFLEIFKKFTINFDFHSTFMEMGEISFIVNKDAATSANLITSIFSDSNYTSVEVVSTIAYESLILDYYSTLKERILRSFRGKLSNIVTINSTRYIWLKNSIDNLRFPFYNQEILKDKIRGKAGVIVGAGPSLNKHFDLLQDLKDRSIMIGASSAIRILNSRGISPDFKMVIDAYPDPSIYDEDFFDHEKSNPILFAGQTYREILPKYSGDKYHMILPTDMFSQYIYKLMDEEYEIIRSGASVVHSAFSFLAQAGCNPIIFIGQDMCFYDEKLYASGIESLDQNSFDERGWITMKDVYGNDVQTVRGYLQIKYDYEELIKNYPKVRVINASEGGLGIEGTEFKPLADVLRDDLTDAISLDLKSYKEPDPILQINSKRIIAAFDTAIVEINELIFSIDEIMSFINKIEQMSEKHIKSSKIFKEIEHLENILEKKLHKNMFYRLVARHSVYAQAIALKMKYTSKNDSEKKRIESAIQYYRNIYSELLIFSNVCKEWMEEYQVEVNGDSE